jgi:hypothetical protein
VAKKEQPRDWDKELAEVDRLLNQLPTHREEQAAAAPAAKRSPTAPAAPAGGASSGEWLGTWARVGLGVLLGLAMPLWPYDHSCGIKLFIYLAGVLTVIVAGVWSGLSSWKRRLGLAHIISQGLLIWGLVLAAREILPRVHYAKAPATWFCP